jgi:hypothetical protein
VKYWFDSRQRQGTFLFSKSSYRKERGDLSPVNNLLECDGCYSLPSNAEVRHSGAILPVILQMASLRAHTGPIFTPIYPVIYEYAGRYPYSEVFCMYGSSGSGSPSVLNWLVAVIQRLACCVF